jgi:2-oxoglutarate dehydrogenase E2 component (dihydrolipoamide succinyltransferase)
MSTEVVMPQMGESITEGTVSKWLKNVGDRVDKDEPILEISTDKVDAEVPSPGAGVLLEIRTAEGETVEVGTVVAIVGEEGEAGVKEPAPPPEVEEAVTAAEEPVADTPVEAASETPTTVETTTQPSDSEEQPTPAAKHASAASSDATEIVMPQMGESITEGTVSKWLKSVGDKVDKDEALLEISTDKVDAEVPSPAAGTLLAINVQEGETVEVGAVLALVGAEGSAASAPKPEAAPVTSSTAPTPSIAYTATPVSTAPTNGGGKTDATIDELRRTKSSPLVRNIAREHSIDITRIPGSGLSGRVTKNDIMSFIETGAALRPEDLLVKGAPKPASLPETPKSAPARATTVATEDRVEKMSVMRKKIAEHMTFSKQTSAHVTSVYEIDMTNVAKFRTKHQADFQAKFGTKLTYMPFIFEAVTAAIREFRIVNSQVDGDQIIYKGDINLGMAVALDWGLIVPVLRNADTLSLSQLATAANDLADRARTKKLKPDEVQGGTFTITNPGVFGGLYGTPIINQPQVAILCVGTIEKRTKVLTSSDGDDYIAIRQMAYFALTYDHRVVDGADAERFLSSLKSYLENTNFEY